MKSKLQPSFYDGKPCLQVLCAPGGDGDDSLLRALFESSNKGGTIKVLADFSSLEEDGLWRGFKLLPDDGERNPDQILVLSQKFEALRQYVQNNINEGVFPLPANSLVKDLLKPHELLPPREPNT